ncbi:MAG: hypothetical protein V2A59_00935 [Candidatus Omnitrophota bacterium]
MRQWLRLFWIVVAMREEIRVFAQDAPQSDDITMLVVKYKGKPSV